MNKCATSNVFTLLFNDPLSSTWGREVLKHMSCLFGGLLTRTGIALTLGTTTAVLNGLTIGDIHGVSWISPYDGRYVSNLTGIVTGKVARGVFIQGVSAPDIRISSGLYIYDTTLVRKVDIGDEISLSGRVLSYRGQGNQPPISNLVLSSNLHILSSGNHIEPIVLPGPRGKPSGEHLSGLDARAGGDGWLSIPNNQTQISSSNATLENTYGMDFWRTLEGMLVTIQNPVAVNFNNRMGEFWIRGDWQANGVNGRGGMTVTTGNANAGAIMVHKPMDRSKNPTIAIGTTFSDITGIVHYQFGFFYLIPLTAPAVRFTPPYNPPPSPYIPAADPCSIIVGDYNVENMSPNVVHLPRIAAHIVDYLKTPDLVFLQEIQDDSGKKNDGTVSANITLQTLTDAIYHAGAPFNYSFVDVPPINNHDGGIPGGNIRPAYLYNPHKISLVPGSLHGDSLDANKVVVDASGQVGLLFNPGRIDPANAAWNMSRKPLAANWQTISGERFFTINVHYSSKRGSSSLHGDARPPVNGAVAERTRQVEVTAAFAKTLLDADPNASLVIAGDMNEHVYTTSVFAGFDGLVHDLDAVAGIPEEERYTYVYDQNMQEIDHLFVSPAISTRKPALEHIHVNTWAPSERERASDHDPSVAQLRVCTNLQRFPGAASLVVGGLPAPAVTQRGDKYYVKGQAFTRLATARTDSCKQQLTSCSELAKAGAVGKVDCFAQEARCLLRVIA